MVTTGVHEAQLGKPESILQEAHRLVHGARQQDYDTPTANFTRIAAGWEVILGVSITPQQVALAMIWTKVCREIHRPKRDNRVDIAGYAETLDMVEEGYPGKVIPTHD